MLPWTTLSMILRYTSVVPFFSSLIFSVSCVFFGHSCACLVSLHPHRFFLVCVNLANFTVTFHTHRIGFFQNFTFAPFISCSDLSPKPPGDGRWSGSCGRKLPSSYVWFPLVFSLLMMPDLAAAICRAYSSISCVHKVSFGSFFPSLLSVLSVFCAATHTSWFVATTGTRILINQYQSSTYVFMNAVINFWACFVRVAYHALGDRERAITFFFFLFLLPLVSLFFVIFFFHPSSRERSVFS